MSRDQDSLAHPYGVLPLGNAMFCDPKLLQVRPLGLGKLRKLNDECVLEVLGYLTGKELAYASMASKMLYCFCMSSDLWRDLTLRAKNESIDFVCSWRDTFARDRLLARGLPAPAPHRPLRVSGAFSDLLFRLWSCASLDFAKLRGFEAQQDVPRMHADSGIHRFLPFERAGKPVIVTGLPWAPLNWVKKPSSEDGKQDSKQDKQDNEPNKDPETVEVEDKDEEDDAMCGFAHLASLCGDALLRSTSPTAPLPALFAMTQYLSYLAQTREEAPLYLFERDFLTKCPKLQETYTEPSFFSASGREALLSRLDEACLADGRAGGRDLRADGQTDLLRCLGTDGRPDFRWLVLGPRRSGSLFHIDPNGTCAWNCSLRGRKKWLFYRPGHAPPGVSASEDLGDVTVPLSTGEWLQSFWPAHLEEREKCQKNREKNREKRKREEEREKTVRDAMDVDESITGDIKSVKTEKEGEKELEEYLLEDHVVLEAVTGPGELLFVPAGWWHMVVNLDHCAAITQNYCARTGLARVLAFLRERRDQVSGLRDRGEVEKEVANEGEVEKGEKVEKEAEKTAGDRLADALYESLVEALPTIMPREEVCEAVRESFCVDLDFARAKQRDASERECLESKENREILSGERAWLQRRQADRQRERKRKKEGEKEVEKEGESEKKQATFSFSFAL